MYIIQKPRQTDGQTFQTPVLTSSYLLVPFCRTKISNTGLIREYELPTYSVFHWIPPVSLSILLFKLKRYRFKAENLTSVTS